MKKTLPWALVAAALGAAVLLSRRAGPSRESVLPLSRTIAEQEKAIDRAAAAAAPVSPDEERRFGAGLDKGMSRWTPKTPADRKLVALWKRLGAAAEKSSLVSRFRGRYKFRVSPGVEENAFALPGGFIYVTLPLLRKLGGDEDALMGVLGHELGHVELGHCADMVRRERNLFSASLWLASIHFSTTQELEADAFSVRLMRSLGRDPRAFLRAFDALGIKADERTKRGPGDLAAEAVSSYFRTHPGAWERRAALEREIERTR